MKNDINKTDFSCEEDYTTYLENKKYDRETEAREERRAAREERRDRKQAYRIPRYER